jgi:fluoride exporter
MVWLLVLLGGGLGAMARYGVGIWMQHHIHHVFPWATLTVNVVGAFVIGIVIVLADERESIGPSLRTFLVVGILGGFTTFSSFSAETFRLWERGTPWYSGLNVLASVALCLVAVRMGVAVARTLK